MEEVSVSLRRPLAIKLAAVLVDISIVYAKSSAIGVEMARSDQMFAFHMSRGLTAVSLLGRNHVLPVFLTREASCAHSAAE